MKGVETGDLGPKYGYQSKDNGWAKFNEVRIPRRNMLMGVASVEKDGSFNLKADARVVSSGGAFLNHGDTVRVVDAPAAQAAPAAPATK